MGIDKSLTDDFPSVVINDTRYHYGRENVHGQYLVENAEYAKDYWCFNKKKDLLAFLVNLPETADRDWIRRRYPDWDDVTPEQRDVYMEERDAHFRKRMEEKQKDGTADYFNVLQFDDDGSGWYSVYAGPQHWDACDNVEVQVREHEDPAKRTKELVIDLRTIPGYGEEQRTITVWRRQALKLASALIKSAGYVEDRLPEPLPDDKKL